MDYKVRDLPADVLEEAKPRNILEEIVWYKGKEIDVWKDKVPLQLLMVGAQLRSEWGHRTCQGPGTGTGPGGDGWCHTATCQDMSKGHAASIRYIRCWSLQT